MKKSFTLIELMVTIAIIGVLFSTAVPLYDKQVLKSKFDTEAALVLKSIMLAQEQYHIETGKYYTSTDGNINNESVISSNLKINLNKSNNFLYIILETADEQSYLIKAILRSDDWAICTDSVVSKYCKQENTLAIDSWPSSYTRSDDKHFLKMQYPTELIDSVNGISYADIFTGD